MTSGVAAGTFNYRNDHDVQKPQTENTLRNTHDICDKHLYTSTRLEVFPLHSLTRFTHNSLQMRSQVEPLTP